MCCINLTLATKLIGTIGLSMSILMINLIVSEFFSVSEEEEFLIALESWMLFGLNWTYVMRCLRIISTARKMLTCVLVYTTISLIANVLLALASVYKRAAFALPWLYFQMVNIIDQAVALGIRLTREDDYDGYDKPFWYIPVSSSYLLISSFFWLVVTSARKEWIMTSPSYHVNSNCNNCQHQAQTQGRDSNLPKTPSYISTKMEFFSEYPRPDPPPKYEVV